MRFVVVSLFPEMFEGPFGQSILKRAREAGLIETKVINPRDFTTDKHHIVDDYPFGGGVGMVMKPDPLFAAVESLTLPSPNVKRRVVLMCPGGTPFTQAKAVEFAEYEELVLVCGHYEGFDERVRLHLVDESLSIGDYVLTGGELPAMVIVDTVSRLIPGVLGDIESAHGDSFWNGLLEYPQYTRPRDFRGWAVPDVLVSGDHAKIDRWRRKESLRNTLERRPDLLQQRECSPEDRKLLAEIAAEYQED